MTTASAADERPIGDVPAQRLDPRRDFNALSAAMYDSVAAVERPAVRVGAAILDRCRALAATYPAGTDSRRVVEASVEYLVAMHALAREADWIEPLVRGRRSLGRIGRGIVFREMYLPRLRFYGLISAGIAAALIGLQLAVFALSS